MDSTEEVEGRDGGTAEEEGIKINLLVLRGNGFKFGYGYGQINELSVIQLQKSGEYHYSVIIKQKNL